MTWLFALLACGPKHPPLQAPLGLEHPLLHQIWTPSDDRIVTREAMLADLAAADLVLIGEKHDNPDHHRAQAELIAALQPSGVVFEMLDVDDATDATDADELAKQVGWADTSWPDFAVYRPVFAATYAAGAAVVAGHPTREQVDVAMKESIDALPSADLEGLALDRTLSEHARAVLADEIVEAHCGHAPEQMIDMMARAQRLKDLFLARALRSVEGRAVLIAGTGHTRYAGGVPVYVDDLEVRVVHLVEVQADAPTPRDYEAEQLWREGEAPSRAPADYVWFTARVDDLDPCERFKKQLEKMRPPE